MPTATRPVPAPCSCLRPTRSSRPTQRWRPPMSGSNPPGGRPPVPPAGPPDERAQVYRAGNPGHDEARATPVRGVDEVLGLEDLHVTVHDGAAAALRGVS